MTTELSTAATIHPHAEHHKAPEQRIADLSRNKGETRAIIHSLGQTLEELLSNAAILIVHFDPRLKKLIPIFVSSAFAGSKIAEQHPLSDTSPHGYAILRKEDLLLFNLRSSPFSQSLALFLENAPLDAAIVRRIRPSNGDCWGCIAAFFNNRPVQPAAEFQAHVQHNDVWIQLATTIIERRLLEDALRTEEIRSDLAARAAGIGIFDWNIASNDLFWSPQAARIYNKEAPDGVVQYRDWAQITNPADLATIESDLERTFKQQARSFQSLSRFTASGAGERWAKTIAEIIYNSEGKPVRMIGTVQDVTETLKAEEQKNQDRRRLELALEAGELGFWDWHIPSGEVQFGGEWAAMLGYSLSELNPHVSTWDSLVHPDDKASVEVVLKKHLHGLSPFYESEHRLKAKDGSWIWVLDRGRVVERSTDGAPIRALGIHANISQKRAVQEALREADQRKDEFLATLAHELRNPLAPIRTGLGIIKKSPSSPQAIAAREMMERQLAHMVRLVDDLLDVSRITTGRLALKKQLHSVRSIIDTAIEASLPTIEAAHHTLSVEYPTEDAQIFCDATRVAQTICNILTNAAKYTPDGGSIQLSAHTAKGFLHIAVSDNGSGIPADMLDHVFDLFGQVNRTLERSQGGLGIGLALVKNLVQLHGGEVTVSSAGINRGSTFTVRLPLAAPKEDADRKMENHSTDSAATPLAKRILIVDDNVDGAKSMAIFTELLGHTVEVAYNGSEALEKFSTFRPDIVFLDIGLPGMSGFEVAQAIRQLPQAINTKLIALTGWGSEDTKRSARSVGFDEHLTKPVELTDIEAMLTH
jgi:PAS domain S-box-containing protein